jgi:hypothetical protein
MPTASFSGEICEFFNSICCCHAGSATLALFWGVSLFAAAKQACQQALRVWHICWYMLVSLGLLCYMHGCHALVRSMFKIF